MATPLELVCTVHVFKEGDKPVALIGLADGQHLLVTEDMVRIYENEESVRLAQPTNYMQRHPLATTDESAEAPTGEGDQADADETPDQAEGGQSDNDAEEGPAAPGKLL